MPDMQVGSWHAYVTPLPGTEHAIRPEVWHSVVEKAAFAPSLYDTRPWRFLVRGGALELRADWSGQLAVTDPLGRALAISCGAALQNARLELVGRGIAPRIELCPDPSDGGLLARVHSGAFRPPSLLEESLRSAIATRRPSWTDFVRAHVPEPMIEQLERAARVEHVMLHRVDDAARTNVAAMAVEGDRARSRDPAFRKELATRRPSAAWGRWPVRRTRHLAMRAPVLLVLATARDDMKDWVTAGLALQRVLLLATTLNLTVAILDSVTSVPPLRERLRTVLGLASVPHLLLCAGSRPRSHHDLRRVADVLTD